jgi:DNA-directed RNA polymerase subunit D
MKIEIIKQEKNKLSFLMRGITFNLANALRRYADEVYVLAADTVEIISNDSSLFDEILAHRIGLIPLVMEKTFTPKEECSCKGKGCLKCTAELTLKAEGPCTVYASDMKSKTVKPVFGDMPIIVLDKGQKIELVVEARLGQTKKHAKFSPGLIWYRAYPEIVTKDCNPEIAEVCPQKVFEAENGKLIVKNLTACDLCNACVEECKRLGKGSISVKGSEQDFVFNIESWGQIPAKNIFLAISEKLEEDLSKLAKEADKIK